MNLFKMLLTLFFIACTLTSCVSRPDVKNKPVPVLLESVKADYPLSAYQHRKNAIVKVSYDVDDEGVVRNPQVIFNNSEKDFETSAINSILKWKYEKNTPYQGMTMTFKFNITNKLNPGYN